MRPLICAGCSYTYQVSETTRYRKKIWCGSDVCKDVIDIKVKHKNYKRRQKKILNGTFRSGVEQSVRFDILQRDDFTCNICKSYDYNSEINVSRMQVHHILPVSEGGEDSEDNLVTLCSSCHNSVHSDGWESYVKVLQENY